MSYNLRDAYALFHRALAVFALMSVRGIPVDRQALADLREKTIAERNAITKALSAQCVHRYEKKYGQFDIGSGQDQQRLYYGVLGLSPLKNTKSGKDLTDPLQCSTDAASREHLLTQVEVGTPEHDLIAGAGECTHLVKLLGYINGWQELMDKDGLLNSSFLLHSVSSYRSSCADPNFQNIPIRNPILARLRRCLVPKNDWFLEMDFSGAEVRGYAVYSGDETLIHNIRNGIDFHRYYASLLFDKQEKEITKAERYKAKNSFVFPEFYGSYYKTISAGRPEWPEARVKKTEDKMWADMPKVKAWQKRTQKEYEDRGYLQYLTGFQARYGGKGGLLSSNQICNIPNQGFAFHRLLKVLCDVEDEMRRRNMKSWICGQIHDSVVFDVVDEELDDVVDLTEEIVARPAFGFDDVVPWEAEFGIGKNFLDKVEL